MTVRGDADGVFLNALQSQIERGIVTSFVVVASFTDEDGDECIYCDTMTDQRCHRTMGLLSWGLAVEEARAQDSWREDDE